MEVINLTISGNSSATPGSTGVQPENAPVQASTLLWAFIPIALNTMTQPSGHTLGLSRRYNFALRISPFVCAANVWYTLIQLVFFTYEYGSIKAAYLAVVSCRFKELDESDGNGGEGNETDHGKVTGLRRNSVFRLGLFVLGTLPQAIIVFASSGIVIAGIFCSCFLASFFLDEAILYFAAGRDPSAIKEYDSRTPLGSHLHHLRQFASSESFSKMIVSLSNMMTCVLFATATQYDVGFSITVFLIQGLSSLAGLYFDLGDDGIHCVLTTCIAFGLALAPLRDLVDGQTNIFMLTLGAAWVLAQAGLDYLTRLFESRVLKTIRDIMHFKMPLVPLTLFIHITLGLLFLTCYYDDSSTRRPSWTNWFG